MTIDLATLEANRHCPFGGGCRDCPCGGNCNHVRSPDMINDIITDANGQRWRAKAKSMKAAINEIAHARCTGSVGSSTMLDETRCGGTITLVAEVHKIDADGNDVQPS